MSWKKWLEKYPDNYFYYPDTKEYIEKCDNHQSWIDFETKTFIYVWPSKTNSNCPENFPYKYKTSCLRNCLDTNNEFFSSTKGYFNSNYQKKTYSFISNINQKKNVLKVVKWK